MYAIEILVFEEGSGSPLKGVQVSVAGIGEKFRTNGAGIVVVTSQYKGRKDIFIAGKAMGKAEFGGNQSRYSFLIKRPSLF